VERVLQCDCGFEVRAEHEHALVAEVQRHAREAHGMALSHNEALLLTFRAELDATAPPRTFTGEPAHGSSQDSNLGREEEK
jgi:Protein of unknown function (DUF1059)